MAPVDFFDCLRLGFIFHFGYDDTLRWLVRLGRTCRAGERRSLVASSAELWRIVDQSKNGVLDAIEKVGLGHHAKHAPKI